jgi:flagellar biosynthetic protein FliP
MTIERTAAPVTSGARRAATAVLEYLAMVAAMVIGMVALDAARTLVLPGVHLVVELETLVMLAGMSMGMTAWMAFRRHGVRSIALMCAAMVVPFLVLLPLHWAGAVSADGLMTGGHLLMLPAMALAMPFAHRHGHGHGHAGRRTGR